MSYARPLTVVRVDPIAGGTAHRRVPTTLAVEARAGLQPGLRLGWAPPSDERFPGEFSIPLGQHAVSTIAPTSDLWITWGPSIDPAASPLELVCWHAAPVQAPQPRRATFRLHDEGSATVPALTSLFLVTPLIPNTLAELGQERETDQLWFDGYLRAVGPGTGWFFLLRERNPAGTLSVTRRVIPISAGSPTGDYAYQLRGAWRGDMIPVPFSSWQWAFHNPTANPIALEWRIGTLSSG